MKLAALVKIFVEDHIESDLFEEITKGGIGVEHLVVVGSWASASWPYPFDVLRIRMKPVGDSDSKIAAGLEEHVAGPSCGDGFIGP
jgi:hypothetical protein